MIFQELTLLLCVDKICTFSREYLHEKEHTILIFYRYAQIGRAR